MEPLDPSYTLVRGRIRVTERCPGTRGHSLELGHDAATRGRVLVTRLFVLGGDPMPPRSALAFEHEGVAPLLACERVAFSEGIANVIAEGVPRGRRSDALAPMPVAQAVAVADAVAEILQRAHAVGDVVMGIRPEYVYLSDDGVVGLTPRGPWFRALSWPAGATVEGQVPPFVDLYLSPEGMGDGPPGASSDVFSLCATLSFWIEGRPPFAGETMRERLMAFMASPPQCAAVPEPLRAVIRRGLVHDPAERPSLIELRKAFARA